LTERRFALASSQTAWIAATYEIAGAPALLVIGYLGSNLRRPVWIGAGLIMLGIGFGVYSIPHFAAPPYRYSDAGDSKNLCIETPAWTNSSTIGTLPANGRYCYTVKGLMHVCAIVAAMLRPIVSCIAQLSSESQQRKRS